MYTPENQILDLTMLCDCIRRLGGREDFIESSRHTKPAQIANRGPDVTDTTFRGLQHFVSLLCRISDRYVTRG